MEITDFLLTIVSKIARFSQVNLFCAFDFSAAKIAVVKLEGPPCLCKSDEVGELCIASGATGSAYWGLAGKTNQTFKVLICWIVVEGERHF